MTGGAGHRQFGGDGIFDDLTGALVAGDTGRMVGLGIGNLGRMTINARGIRRGDVVGRGAVGGMTSGAGHWQFGGDGAYNHCPGTLVTGDTGAVTGHRIRDLSAMTISAGGIAGGDSVDRGAVLGMTSRAGHSQFIGNG